MKKAGLTVAAVGLALFLCGCWQKSIYPFCKESEVIFDATLLGTWIDPTEQPQKSSWTFARGQRPSVYRVSIKDNEVDLDYEGRLFKLGEEQFLDLYSRRRSVAEMPTHNLLRVRKNRGDLEIRVLQPDGVRDWVQAHPAEIAHIDVADPENPEDKSKGETVLSAQTDELQKFVRAHLDEKNFFSEPSTLKKRIEPGDLR